MAKQQVVSKNCDKPKAPRDRDPKTGCFLPGNGASTAESRKKMPCPAWMESAGLAQLWKRVAKNAVEGDIQSAKQVTAWVKEGDGLQDDRQDEIQSLATEYEGLPDEVCELLEELGTGLGNIIERAEANLPLSEIETLVYKYARRFATGKKRSYPALRMKQAIRDILAEIRADVEKEIEPDEQEPKQIRPTEQTEA